MPVFRETKVPINSIGQELLEHSFNQSKSFTFYLRYVKEPFKGGKIEQILWMLMHPQHSQQFLLKILAEGKLRPFRKNRNLFIYPHLSKNQEEKNV
jgi:hypothetical protein